MCSSTPGSTAEARGREVLRAAVYPVQKVVVNLLAPIVNLPTCRAMLARNIGNRHAEHHAFRRDPCPLCLRAPPPTTQPLDHFQPGNPNTFRAVQMDAHFAVSLQIQNLRRTSARRMQASGQKWQEGVGVALKDELVARLHGRYNARPCAGEVGVALRRLGWTRIRDWSKDGGGRRIWKE